MILGTNPKDIFSSIGFGLDFGIVLVVGIGIGFRIEKYGYCVDLGIGAGIWLHLRASGNIWGHPGASGNIWEHLGASGSISEHLRESGVIWEHLGTSGRIWVAWVTQSCSFSKTLKIINFNRFSNICIKMYWTTNCFYEFMKTSAQQAETRIVSKLFPS